MAVALGNDIVIVDDDALTLEYIKRVLRSSNFDVRYFTDELEALSYLENHKTRVLIIDHRMPRLDGLDLLLRLIDGGGIAADNVYLCSAAEPPKHVREKAREYGAELLSKDVFREKAKFLELISHTSLKNGDEMVTDC